MISIFKKLKTLVFLMASMISFGPIYAFAQIRDIESGLGFFSIALDRILPILVLIALFYFIYSVVVFVWKSRGGEEASDEKRKILWGVIGLFVILSIWGIIGIVSRTLGTGTGGVFQNISSEEAKYFV